MYDKSLHTEYYLAAGTEDLHFILLFYSQRVTLSLYVCTCFKIQPHEKSV